MKLRIPQQGILPVAETRRFLGLVTEENLREYISVPELLFARFPQTERGEETRCA